jgi:hypothetical protein
MRLCRQEKYPMTGFYDIEWDNCFQLTHKQTLHGQLVVNRYFYQAASEFTGDPFDIITAFHAYAFSVIKYIQGNNLEYESTHLLQLYGLKQSVEAFYTGIHGDDGGAELPVFFGARFRLIPADTRVRKGRKIFAGITEPIVDGLGVDAAYTARMTAIATFLESTIIIAGLAFTPVLLSPANTRHTGNNVVAIVDASYVGWSTQSSRKVGRGA